MNQTIERLSLTPHFLSNAVAFGLALCLMAVTTPVRADTVVAYGERVPIGFYNYSTNLMSQNEMESIYTEGGHAYDGMSPLTHAIYQWNNRCWDMLGELMLSQESCHKRAKEHHLDMLGACGAEASKRGPNYAFLGRSLTQTAPTHQYAYCVASAENHSKRLEDECDYDFKIAKLEETTCWGSSGWDLKDK